jgi:polyisoprenoid-binding protein YceI
MTTATQHQQIPTGTWTIDPIHSTVAFEVTHMGVSTFRAGFGDVDAALTATDDGVRLYGAAKVESIGIDEPQFRGHVLSPEFFDVERFPEIRFEADDIQIGEGGELVVEGDLTIKDTTRRVEARGRIVGPTEGPDGSGRLGITLETVVDRTDYGLGWNMDLPDGKVVLANDVTLTIQLELVQEAA